MPATSPWARDRQGMEILRDKTWVNGPDVPRCTLSCHRRTLALPSPPQHFSVPPSCQPLARSTPRPSRVRSPALSPPSLLSIPARLGHAVPHPFLHAFGSTIRACRAAATSGADHCPRAPARLDQRHHRASPQEQLPANEVQGAVCLLNRECNDISCRQPSAQR